MRRTIFAVLGALLALGAFAACSDDETSADGANTRSTTSRASTGSSEASGAATTAKAGGPVTFNAKTNVCESYTPASLAKVVGLTFEKFAPTAVPDARSDETGLEQSNSCAWGFESGGAFVLYSVNRLSDRAKGIASFERQFSSVDQAAEGFAGDYAKAVVDEARGSTVIAAKGTLLLYVSCVGSNTAGKPTFTNGTYERCAKPIANELLGRYK